MALCITLNGQSRTFAELDPGASLMRLVESLALKADRVAIEHNGQIASRAAWETSFLSEGDRVELVHFVGGGSDGNASTTADFLRE